MKFPFKLCISLLLLYAQGVDVTGDATCTGNGSCQVIIAGESVSGFDEADINIASYWTEL